MSETQKTIVKILHEFDGMTPEKIEDVRTIWIANMKAEDPERFARIEEFVNDVCEVAINRANRRILKEGAAV